MKALLVLLVSLFLFSCSHKNQNKSRGGAYDENEEATIVDYDDDGSVDEDVNDVLADESSSPVEASEDEVAEVVSEYEGTEQVQDVMANDTGSSVVLNTGNESSNFTGSGMYDEYVVQKNDTFMIIAFKVYGDVNMWKKIYQLNQDKVSSPSMLSAGTRIKYERPSTPFVWEPEGSPYLIVRGDTLMGISNKVYNTHYRWKEIWKNNQPLIRDPDLIFAGLTIYYKDDSGRNQASE